jgi:hypothetical protein
MWRNYYVTHGWGPLEPKGRRREEIARIIRRKKKCLRGGGALCRGVGDFYRRAFQLADRSRGVERRVSFRAAFLVKSDRQRLCPTTTENPSYSRFPQKSGRSGRLAVNRASIIQRDKVRSADRVSESVGFPAHRECSCGPVPRQIAEITARGCTA